MSDIQEDIMQAAENVLIAMGIASTQTNSFAIEQAIMAERKRCAEIASGFESKYAQARDEATNDIEYKMWNAGSYAAMDIASAIMG